MMWNEYKTQIKSWIATPDCEDKIYNAWFPFYELDGWDLAIASKDSIKEDDPTPAKGKGPGQWYRYPNMKGMFGEETAEFLLFRSKNIHSGVAPGSNNRI